MRRKGNPLTLLVGCELVQPLWKTVWRFLKELKKDLPYDPEIALLGIYPKDIGSSLLLKSLMHFEFVCVCVMYEKHQVSSFCMWLLNTICHRDYPNPIVCS